MGFLVLWNEGEYAERLRASLGYQYVLTSESGLLEAATHSDINSVVVLAELNWNDHRLSALYGIEFAKQKLRLEYRLKFPILFASFLDPVQVLRDPKDEIFTAVAHDFSRLPSTPSEWQGTLDRVKELTDLQFTDVMHSFCNVKGAIDEIVHVTQGNIRNRSPQSDVAQMAKDELSAGLERIARLLGDVKEQRAETLRIVNEFQIEINENIRLDRCLELVGLAGERMKRFVMDDGIAPSDVISSSKEKTSWKVLVVDDEPAGLSQILAALSDRGIEYCVEESVKDAECRIEADQYNRIVVAICDYRLKESRDGIIRQQPKQGYDLLLDLSRQDRFTGLIALSGMSRRFLLESFQRYNTRVSVYSKNDLSTLGAVNLFADFILDLGRETDEALCSQPSGGDWKKLKAFYVAHRRSHDYEASERDISDRARDYVTKIEGILLGRDKELFLNPALPPLKDLQAKMHGKDPNNPKHMALFRTKLLGRRIAIWLSLVKGFGANQLYAALNGLLDVSVMYEKVVGTLRRETSAKTFNAAAIESKSKKKLENRVKGLIYTRLALSVAGLPGGILVEEKKWLRHDMGVSLHDVDELLSQVGYHVQVGLERWSQGNAGSSIALSEQSDLFTRCGKPVISSFGDAKRALLMISKTLSTTQERQDFSLLLRTIENKIRSDSYCLKYVSGFSEFVRKLQAMA